ncbi:MAG: adenosylcobinamide-GDP ribazoletransferase [Candidatus Bathyarchaeia archaeon]
MIKEIKNLLGFLTIFPVGMSQDCLADAAKHMYLFPVIGALIGFLAGLLALALNYVLQNLIAGILTCGFILLLTGLHHTDGLLDFGDGLMCQGPPEKKIEVMHDVQTGTGGLMLGLITVLTTALCISQLKRGFVLQSLVVAEVSAKLAMVALAWLGKSAHKGMNTYFIDAMHSTYRKLRLTTALAISLIIAFLALEIAGLITVIAGLFTALILLWISNRHFKGVTGDVMGATNELARMTSLLAILMLATAKIF